MAHPIFQPILDEIARNKTVDGGAVTLIKLLNEKIQNAPTLEEAKQIAAEFAADNQALADAVVANTPSDTPEAKARRAKS
jgi:hypothetical protein